MLLPCVIYAQFRVANSRFDPVCAVPFSRAGSAGDAIGVPVDGERLSPVALESWEGFAQAEKNLLVFRACFALQVIDLTALASFLLQSHLPKGLLSCGRKCSSAEVVYESRWPTTTYPVGEDAAGLRSTWAGAAGPCPATRG